VIMTAAALVKQQPPSMELALAAMYDWLVRHPRITKNDLVVDTGSGLSYHTRATAHELVSILRSAAGFTPDGDTTLSRVWLDSLSIAGTDGTLSSRFRTADVRGRLRGKTGTLSTVIALSGILDVDPQRPLAFSLITNGDTPLSARYVRRTHEQLVGLLCRYLARTRKPTPAPPQVTPALPQPPALPQITPALPQITPAPSQITPAPPQITPAPAQLPTDEAGRSELDELESDPALDDETAEQR